jgi:hypothetical protein
MQYPCPKGSKRGLWLVVGPSKKRQPDTTAFAEWRSASPNASLTTIAPAIRMAALRPAPTDCGNAKGVDVSHGHGCSCFAAERAIGSVSRNSRNASSVRPPRETRHDRRLRAAHAVLFASCRNSHPAPRFAHTRDRRWLHSTPNSTYRTICLGNPDFCRLRDLA